ncbi:RagB/SusD family nutrient uptake outer membrane protein [Aequorivita ciconiae]|nr:RagB/SusD family nutrient uptake outer membrane protein [Aequorivita sp. H23M31]
MKNIKSILILMVASVLFVSCEDAYDIKPAGILDDEATFQTVEDAKTFLNGIYGLMDNTTEIYFTSVFTDEVAPSPGYNGQDKDLHRFVLDFTSGYASAIWLKHNRVINRVNRLVNGADLVTVQEGEQAELNDIVAQGKTLRALSYLTLLSYFSPDMTDDNALGAILFTNVPTVDELLPRSTNGACFALIEEDLNYAEANLDSHEFIYPTKSLVNAIRARMYAYRGNYPMAKTYANKVINDYGLTLTPSTPFDLSNFYKNSVTNPYRQIWADSPARQVPSDRLENIYSLQSYSNANDYGFSPAGLYYFNVTNITGSPIWGMSLKLYDKLGQMPDDVREYAFVDPTTDLSINAVMIDKYPGIPGGPLRNNLKLFRLSEMYLILAEAQAAAGQIDQVALTLNSVQKARSTTGNAAVQSYANATEAWGAIMDERRKELCFEGHRYVDIKRLGVLANKSIDRSDFDDEVPGMPLTISNTDHRFTLPIPSSEFFGNPGIQQNPGY